MNYWEICVTEAIEEAGIVATKEQIAFVVDGVQGAFDNYDLATGVECIPDPRDCELKEANRKLEIEESKIHCRECNGLGRIVENFGTRSSDTECSRCRGEGRHVR